MMTEYKITEFFIIAGADYEVEFLRTKNERIFKIPFNCENVCTINISSINDEVFQISKIQFGRYFISDDFKNKIGLVTNSKNEDDIINDIIIRLLTIQNPDYFRKQKIEKLLN